MIDVRIPADDRPRVPLIAAVGVASLVAGLALAWWALDPQSRPDEAPIAASEDEPEEIMPTERDGGADTGAEAPSEAAANEPAQNEANEVSANDAPVDGEATAPPPRRGTPVRTFERGRVAYLRCEGARGPRRGGPCPRDEALEDAVWEILATLATCADAPTEAGEADVRLDYERSAAPQVLWRDTFADDVVRLDSERVLGCVRQPLTATRQHLRARELTLSFRFAMR